ncbi:calpain-5-like isoform X2 [Myxocyprinus asiaticus]|nr:calpain-5-like isoform X2 [Myxocyprinus asiaticus]XP_051576347.1 calpain-5-like isoform X2 [Myxocyprinus asiaticus]XP_051576355.1 calpain-5-like isoform X2 [Myxocyprinus asiaticus]XP_051576363.1 calpain-5-like isoform X2 [Myxocyprinus asiaticus]
MPEKVCKFQGQCYHKLKRACLRRGALFQDPYFPPSAESLFYKRAPPPGLKWKRPKELCKDPRLFVDGISTRDLHQGSLGNCWMVAATSCLATEPSLWKKVIPDHAEQEWNPKRPDLYAGIFLFRFWRLGQWTDVVVDDRLPVSEDGTLLFCRSATPREFWSALLEKAYAKLNGCYEALEGGNTAEALVDFTGGVSEPLSLDKEELIQHVDQRRMLFQTLAHAHSHRALITCSIRPAEGEQVESVLDCGLIKGHAYGVTAVRKLRMSETLPNMYSTSRMYMVRMRNPWGTTDWTGAWSLGSPQWQQLGRREREKMGLIVRDVGEFWMDFEDFCRYFTDMVVCRLAENSFLCPHWREVRCPGAWTYASGISPMPSSSGCQNFKNQKCSTGPQWSTPMSAQRGDKKKQRLSERQKDGRSQGGKQKGKENKEVKAKPKKGVQGPIKEQFVRKHNGIGERRWEKQMDKRSRCGGCINHRDTFLHNPQFIFEVVGDGDEVLICLQQEDKRMKRREGRGDNLPIGFEVLRVEVNRVCRVQCLCEQAASSVYMDSRSVTLRVTLGPGRYVILPTTFQPGATGQFLLRFFSHSHVCLRELKEELPAFSVWQCCVAEPSAVTTVHLLRASGLSLPKQSAPDVYAVIRCEEDSVRTRVFQKDGNPEFNIKAIFYSRNQKSKISIELWRRGLLLDSFLGRAHFQTGGNERERNRVIDLQGGQSHGCVFVETSSSQCLTDL